jgi:hypothetical protein
MINITFSFLLERFYTSGWLLLLLPHFHFAFLPVIKILLSKQKKKKNNEEWKKMFLPK